MVQSWLTECILPSHDKDQRRKKTNKIECVRTWFHHILHMHIAVMHTRSLSAPQWCRSFWLVLCTFQLCQHYCLNLLSFSHSILSAFVIRDCSMCACVCPWLNYFPWCCNLGCNMIEFLFALHFGVISK